MLPSGLTRSITSILSHYCYRHAGTLRRRFTRRCQGNSEIGMTIDSSSNDLHTYWQ